MEGPDLEHFECPIQATMSLIGGKWKTVILWNLKDGSVRFNQLMGRMEGVSPKMLTKQLRELERDGLVERKVYAEIPPRVEYSLTPMALSLCPILVPMAEWGMANLKGKCTRCEGK